MSFKAFYKKQFLSCYLWWRISATYEKKALRKTKSYVGDNISYVGLIISYVGDNISYVGLLFFFLTCSTNTPP